MRCALCLAAMLLAATPAIAQSAPAPRPIASVESAQGVQMAVFKVENMTCALCPLTVKKAMEAVPGVVDVKVDAKNHVARVRFDPARATPGAISAASGRAGYPAVATTLVRKPAA